MKIAFTYTNTVIIDVEIPEDADIDEVVEEVWMEHPAFTFYYEEGDENTSQTETDDWSWEEVEED